MKEKAIIYTDAGKQGLPTYGFYSPTSGETAFFIRPSPRVNIAVAEMWAIEKALKSKTAYAADDILIYCDSTNVIDYLKSRKLVKRMSDEWRRVGERLLALHDALTLGGDVTLSDISGKKIEYVWIDGRLNMADGLLRKAIQLTEIDAEYPLVLPDVETVIKEWKVSSPIRKALLK